MLAPRPLASAWRWRNYITQKGLHRKHKCHWANEELERDGPCITRHSRAGLLALCSWRLSYLFLGWCTGSEALERCLIPDVTGEKALSSSHRGNFEALQRRHSVSPRPLPYPPPLAPPTGSEGGGCAVGPGAGGCCHPPSSRDPTPTSES